MSSFNWIFFILIVGCRFLFIKKVKFSKSYLNQIQMEKQDVTNKQTNEEKDVSHTNVHFNEYYSAYFKTLRDEIGISLQSHTKFVVQKIVAVMAAFVILFNGELIVLKGGNISTESYCKLMLLLIIISIAYVYDILIAKNICNIHKMGYFIKYHIEKPCDKMWEHYLKQDSNERVSFNYLDFIGIIIFDFFLILISIFLTFSSISEHFKFTIDSLFSATNNVPYLIFIMLYIICISIGGIVYRKIYRLINMVFDNNGKEVN